MSTETGSDTEMETGGTETMTVREAIRSALREELEDDEDVFVMGEDVGEFGGVFEVTAGLVDEFSEERIRDTPISEAGFVGAGVVGPRQRGADPSLR